MTIQDFIKQGHKWIELKGVPVRDSHSKSIVFIHNHFFEGKELEFQNELISNFMKLCPDKEWSWRVYGGDTPDADMVGWIYTQTAEIVSGDESVMPASEITDDTFFIKGKKYRCIRDVVMKKGGKTAFKAGSIYEQTNEPTHWVGWLRNEQGERHGWPQPVYIADEVKTWGTKPEDIDPRLYFEPVEDETYFSDTLDDDLKAGDRVLSRHYGAQATVLGREWDKQRKAWYYRVKFDTMQRHMDGSEFNVTEFHRDGLTKNYDPATGRERVGNAEYYRESLLAEFWGNDRTPRTVYGMEIFKPTDRRPSWLVVADIFSEPKEMTLREVCDMLAARYQEEQGKAA